MSQNATHTVTLRAVDGVSTAFRTMGQSAQTAAQQISAGGKAASAGIAQVDAAALKAQGSVSGLRARMGEFSQTGAALGVSLATVAGFLADAARSAAEEAAELERLEQAVNATGASFDVLSGQVDTAIEGAKALSFADDQAVNALNSLTSTTGDAEQALTLLGLSMDLARGKGIDLATASGIIGKVAAGNTAILSRYGIVLDEGATSTEALAAIQERFADQAETFADTQAGAAQRFKDALDDQVESIGASTGALQGLLLVMPGITSTFQVAGAAVGGFGAVAARAIPFVVGLTAAMGPLALLLAGGAALGFLAFKVKESGDRAEEAKDPVADLTTLIEGLGEAADKTTVSFLTTQLIPELEQAIALADKAQTDLNSLKEQTYDAPLAGLGIMPDIGKDAAEQTKAIDEAREAAERLILTDQDRIDVREDLTAIILEGDRAEIDAANRRIAAFNDEETSAQRLKEDLDDIANGKYFLAGAIAEVTEAVNAYIPSAWETAKANQAIADSAQFILDKYVKIPTAALDAANAMREIVANSAAGGVISFPTQASGSQSEMTRIFEEDQRRQAEAEQENYRRRQQEIADEARLNEEIARLKEDALQEEARIAEERARLTDDLTAAERDGAREVEGITRDRIAAQRDLEHGYAQDIRGLQQQRVADERETAQALRGIDAERMAAAEDAERQLADLAAERSTVQRDLAQEMADAQREWQETSAESLRAQSELRDELRQSTADAARAWQDLNADNLAAQRDIREELQRTLREQQTAFQRTQQDLGSDLAQAKEDLKNAQDPEFYDATAVANAQQRIDDIRLAQKRAREDNKREEADARREARDEQKSLEDDRLAAQQDYHERVRELESETADRIKDLEADRVAALNDYRDAQKQANAEAASQLADLAKQEESILAERGKRFAQLEKDRQVVLRDSAREQQAIARETQQAQEGLEKGAARIAATAAKETTQAMSRAQSDIDVLRAELVALTEEQYTVNVKVKRRDGDTEEEQARQDRRDPEPLDTPRRALGGPIPHFALGGTRPYVVGEYGPELRVGNLIVPTGAAQSRGDYPAQQVIHQYVFPNARFELKTPDLGREVAAYVNQQRRR